MSWVEKFLGSDLRFESGGYLTDVLITNWGRGAIGVSLGSRPLIAHEKFWMVVGDGVPYYRHKTKRSAIVEAERLCRSNPDSSFTVMESLGTVNAERTDVVLAWSVNAQMSREAVDEEIKTFKGGKEADIPF